MWGQIPLRYITQSNVLPQTEGRGRRLLQHSSTKPHLKRFPNPCSSHWNKMLIEINFRTLNLLERQVVLTPKCLRSAYLNKGPGEAAKMFTNTALRKYWFIVSQQTAKPRSLQISTQLLLTPRHQRSSPSPETAAPQHYPRPLWRAALLTQHSPPLVYTSSCRLMLDLSTREWRTLRTLWTFQILGLERRKSISSSDFLAVLQRYWLNDWNCRGEGKDAAEA